MNRIKEIRKIFKLNQTQLAEKLNTTQQTISNWENGVTDIDLNSLLIISNTFDLSVDYILGKTDLTIGERIKQLRQEKGITQEELGKVIGVQKSAIRKYESGMVENIKRNSIIKLANYFEISTDFLLGMTNETIKSFDDNNTNTVLNNSLIIIKKNKIQSFQFTDNEIDAILLLLNKYKN